MFFSNQVQARRNVGKTLRPLFCFCFCVCLFNASVQHPAVTSFICLIAIQKHNHMMLLDADSLTSDPSLVNNFIQLLLMMFNERVVI